LPSPLHDALPIFDVLVVRHPVAAIGGIAVSEVEPERAIIRKHPAHLTEHGHQLLHERIDGRLQSNLAVHAIVTQSEVRRAGYARLHGAIGHAPQDFSAITCVYLDHSSSSSPASSWAS